MRLKLMNGEYLEDIKRVILGRDSATIVFKSGVVISYCINDICDIEDAEL